ncbi:MAG: hypothetical protein E7404_04205 [Ruminococcaceae bacterium]|nr:hypothetical protein [Oscillospiraceae bacterium]
MKRRLILVLLCVSMVSGLFTAPVCTYAEGEVIYSNAPSFLQAVNVIKEYDSEEENLKAPLLRHEMAKIVVGLIGGADIAKGYVCEPVFEDVASDSLNGDYIYYAYQNNLISGNGGFFRPKDETTYAEFVKTLVVLLGYNVRATYEGGYPYGYLKVANAMDFDIGKSADEVITREEAYHLAFVAAETEIMATDILGEKTNYKIQDGKTLLNTYLGVKVEEGIITSNGNTSIYSKNAAGEGRIVINDTAYVADERMQRKYLGFNSLVYIDEDTNKVLFIRENDSNTAYSVKSDLISDETVKNSFRYFKDENDTVAKRLKLGDNTSVIYNEVFLGKIYTNNVTANDLMPDSGNVYLLDNDSDGTIDVVFVTDYKSYAVDHVSKNNEKIYVKAENSELDINDNVSLTDVEGNSVDYLSLEEWNIVSVAGSKDYYNGVPNSHANIVVVKNELKGAVNAIGDDYVVIDEKEYKISADFEKEGYAFELGRNGIFYLNVENKIAACDYNQKTEDYGYLIEAYLSDASKNKLIMKIFNKSGNVEEYIATDEVKFTYNGIEDKLEPSELIEKFQKTEDGEKVTENQLIMYSLNTDKTLKSITKHTNTASYDNFSKAFSGDEVHFIARRFQGKYYISATETKIFGIPEKVDDYKQYQLLSVTGIETNKYYDGVEIYDLDEDNFAGALVMKSNSSNSVAKTARIMLVDKVGKMINANGDHTTSVTGLYNGKEIKIAAAETGLVNLTGTEEKWGWQYTDADDNVVQVSYQNVKLEDLKRGDVIQYSLDTSGEISGFRILFRPDKKASTFYRHAFGEYTDLDRVASTDLLMVYNDVVRVSSVAAIIDAENEKAVNFDGDRFDAIIYIYDEKENEIKVGLPGDIVKGDRVLMTYDYASPKELVIFRYK